MKNKVKTSLLAFFLMGALSHAQEIKNMTAEEVMQLAVQNHQQLQYFSELIL